MTNIKIIDVTHLIHILLFDLPGQYNMILEIQSKFSISSGLSFSNYVEAQEMP
jgi:hypothetical protein